MKIAEEMVHHAREVRARLMRPPNAVVDRGIQLRKPKEAKLPVVSARVKIRIKSQRMPEFPKFSTLKIMAATADYFQVTVNDLRSDRRGARIAFIRHVAMYLISKNTYLSSAQVGIAFRRDHTTVLHGIKKIQYLVTTTDELKEPIRQIEEWVSAGNYD